MPSGNSRSNNNKEGIMFQANQPAFIVRKRSSSYSVELLREVCGPEYAKGPFAEMYEAVFILLEHNSYLHELSSTPS